MVLTCCVLKVSPPFDISHNLSEKDLTFPTPINDPKMIEGLSTLPSGQLLTE